MTEMTARQDNKLQQQHKEWTFKARKAGKFTLPKHEDELIKELAPVCF